ncbi:MAG: hypoxanthine-guanine phosphoribosyltransferase [Pseudohongiellaceae bacterium]
MTCEAHDEMLAQAECLYSRAEVESAIDRLAEALTEDLAGDNPLLLCVMNGGIVFSGALLTRLPFRLQLDYVHASRYRGALSGADLHWIHRPGTPLEGRCVLVLDDILDEGDTLAGIRDWCLEQGAARVVTAVLVDKQHDRRCTALPEADHTALYAEDRYLFGYGMDCREYWRNAPGIFALRATG